MLPNTPKLEEYSPETSLKGCNLKKFGQKQISLSKENSYSQNSQNSWNFKISKENKDQTTKNHLNLIKKIIPNNHNSQHTVIYTDGSKILANVGAGIAYMSGRNSGEKSWNLGISLEVFDAELFAIFQALKWTQSFDLGKTKEIWIFSDSQAAIQVE